MTEESICSVSAGIYNVDEGSGEWVAACEGAIYVDLYHDSVENYYRIVAMDESDNALINAELHENLEYELVTEEFHQFFDMDGVPYGLSFLSSEEADMFKKEVLRAVSGEGSSEPPPAPAVEPETKEEAKPVEEVVSSSQPVEEPKEEVKPPEELKEIRAYDSGDEEIEEKSSSKSKKKGPQTGLLGNMLSSWTTAQGKSSSNAEAESDKKSEASSKQQEEKQKTEEKPVEDWQSVQKLIQQKKMEEKEEEDDDDWDDDDDDDTSSMRSALLAALNRKKPVVEEKKDTTPQKDQQQVSKVEPVKNQEEVRKSEPVKKDDEPVKQSEPVKKEPVEQSEPVKKEEKVIAKEEKTEKVVLKESNVKPQETTVIPSEEKKPQQPTEPTESRKPKEDAEERKPVDQFLPQRTAPQPPTPPKDENVHHERDMYDSRVSVGQTTALEKPLNEKKVEKESTLERKQETKGSVAVTKNESVGLFDDMATNDIHMAVSGVYGLDSLVEEPKPEYQKLPSEVSSDIVTGKELNKKDTREYPSQLLKEIRNGKELKRVRTKQPKMYVPVKYRKKIIPHATLFGVDVRNVSLGELRRHLHGLKDELLQSFRAELAATREEIVRSFK